MTRSTFLKRFALSSKSVKHPVVSWSTGGYISNNKKSAVVPAEPKQVDIFGSLPRDIQVEVLGYVAADRPTQVLLMRKVCKRWREILSEDSIYHSALFTASSTLPPSLVSLEAFQNAAWTDDRIRRFRLWKGRTIRYQRRAHPENNNAQPSRVIYRDGFIVWWVWDGYDQYFNFVDLNRTKKPKESFSVKTSYSPYSGWIVPLYTQAGGKLLYMCPRTRDREAFTYGDSERGRHVSFFFLGYVEADLINSAQRLNVVQLQSPLRRGGISLSALECLNGGRYELYCSSDYALVLKGLELLVADIRDIGSMEVLRIIHLHEETSLESPVISTVEISGKDSCLVLLSSETTGCLESLVFSLTSGSLLKRHSTKPFLEHWEDRPPGTVYQVKHDNEFAKDTTYQCQNMTHKEHQPPGHSMHHRWVHIPAGHGSGDECVTGTYEDTVNNSHDASIPSPLLQHRVTFAKQAVSFTALQDSFTDKTVHRISLQIRTTGIGVEQQDSDSKELHDTPPYHHQIGSPTGETAKVFEWSHSARMTAPKDCLIEDGDNIFTDTHQWALQRVGWGPHSILLGDEKALILALPHQLVVWRFETRQMWKDRKKRRMKRLALKALMHGMLLPAYAGVVAVMLPFLCVGSVRFVYNACADNYLKAYREVWHRTPPAEGNGL